MPLSPTSGPSGGASPPLSLVGTDPLTTPLAVVGAHAQNGNTPIFRVSDFADDDVILVKSDAVDGVAEVRIGAESATLPALAILQLISSGPIEMYPGTKVVVGTAFVLEAVNAAPADADLNAGDVALWLDPTNGASALKVKAKQANGAVKTATIPLA